MEPLKFEPYLRPQVWGNRRLESLFGKLLPTQGAYGEAWEISAQSLHVSRVAEGPLKGTLLSDLCVHHAAELFGRQQPAGSAFPLLIKLLDCHELLSVQVHPNDQTARKLLNEENGKTEAWIVLASEPSGMVYAGLLPGTTREKLERHLADNTVEQCLYSFHPQPGDCIFLAAGTVHAVGGGVVLAEVQQSSDATFRLYDWNRLGSDGKPRQLHIAEALASIDWNAGPVRPANGTPISDMKSGVSGESLVDCEYFQLDRFHVNETFDVPSAGRLSIWMVLDGVAELTASTYRRDFRRGETVLVPASAGEFTWKPIAPSGSATMLGISFTMSQNEAQH